MCCSNTVLYSHSRLCRVVACSVLFIDSSCPPPGALIGWPRPGNRRAAIGLGAMREPRGGASKIQKKERERGVGEGRQRRLVEGRGRRTGCIYNLLSLTTSGPSDPG